MIVAPSNPPQTTYQDLAAGAGFVNQANGESMMKLSTGDAALLTNGTVQAVAPTQVVTPAPQATVTLFP